MLMRKSQDFMPALFNDFLDWNWSNVADTTPRMNVIENKSDYQLEFSVPGLVKDDVQLTIDTDNNLVVEMIKENKNEHKDEHRHYLRREFSTEQFRQLIALPDDIHKEAIEAKVENGVLTVTLPKVTIEEKKQLAQTIEVK